MSKLKLRSSRIGERKSWLSYPTIVKLLGLGIMLLSATSEVRANSAGIDFVVPVRWCAVRGSNAVTHPEYAEGQNTQGVLVRRLQRISDKIFIPQTGVSLRPASVAVPRIGREKLRIADFAIPIIDDPAKPGEVIPGTTVMAPTGPLDHTKPHVLTEEGDIIDVDDLYEEFWSVLEECQKEWDDKEAYFFLLGSVFPDPDTPIDLITPASISAAGVMVINIRRSIHLEPDDEGNLPAGIAYTQYGVSIVPDNVSLYLNKITDLEDRTLGHEIGHALGIRSHAEDDSRVPVTKEGVCKNLMYNFTQYRGPGEVCEGELSGVKLEPHQIMTIRTVAQQKIHMQIDLSAMTQPGPVRGELLPDDVLSRWTE